MQKDNRPPIPGRIKRKVRQRCGFGCVICGFPIYHYDHIPGYANVRRHRAEELTLLCATHHDEKTRGFMPNSVVIEANKNPHNIVHGRSSPYAIFTNHYKPIIVLGEQNFTWSDSLRPSCIIPILAYKHAPISFTLDSKGILLNVDARNSFNERVLYIKDSEILVNSGTWDIEFSGGMLKIWEKTAQMVFQMSFKEDRLIIEKYFIETNGITIDVSEGVIHFSRNGKGLFELSGSGTVDANIGILLGPPLGNLSVGIDYGMEEKMGDMMNNIEIIEVPAGVGKMGEHQQPLNPG